MSDLPPGWEWATLDDIGDYINGRAFKRSEWSSDGRPIIRIQNLTGTSDVYNYYRGELNEDNTAHNGDLLISWAATLGSYIWHGPDAAINQHIFKVHSYVDVRFHHYLVDHLVKRLYGQTQGSGMVHITRGRFGGLTFMLPPIAEQRRIVAALEDHLSRLDAGVDLFHQAQKRTSALGDALAHAATVGELVDPLPDDIPAEEFYRQILATRQKLVVDRRREPANRSNVVEPQVPAHWAVVSLDSLCWDIQYGTSAKASVHNDEASIPVIRMGNVQDGTLRMSNLKYLPLNHRDAEPLILSDGDILFNRTNSLELVGKSAVYRDQLGPATFASYLIRCRPVPGVEPGWINLVINSPIGQRYVRAVASQQVGQANVNGTKLASMPIPLPPPKEQHRIMDDVTELRQAVERNAAEVLGAASRAHRLRRSLLTEAFAGRLVPQDPSDEPASVLLERIRAEREGQPKAKRKRKAKANPAQEALL